MANNPYAKHQAAPQGGFNATAAKSKLTPPGIALIVLGVLGMLGMGAYFAVNLVMLLNGQLQPPPEMVEEAERTGFYVGAYGAVVVVGINVLLQILVILSGVAMVKAKSKGLAFSGAILSVIPCLSSSMCFMGIPFGIWALVVLADPNVKRVMK